MITSNTKLCAVIGNPIRHSLSPLLHNALYEKENIDAVMLAFENDSIEQLISGIRALPIHLSAVTIPHKQTIMPLLDNVDEQAQAIGAVNTVIQRNGVLTGYNTDIAGIEAVFGQKELTNKNVLILGAGGVARPIAYFMKNSGAHLFCSSRDLADAQNLGAQFGGTAVEAKNFEEIEFDVIVNATPVGMSPHGEESPIDARHIRNGAVVFDMVYTPMNTKLLREAHDRGAEVISGVHMFVAQALEQEKLWLGKTFDDQGYTDLVTTALKINN